MAVGLLLFLLACPAKSLAAQDLQETRSARQMMEERQRQTPRGRYVINVDAIIVELKDVASTQHDLGKMQVFTTDDEMVPLNGEANLLSLVEIVDEAFVLWNPNEDRPLRVYFLDYETYRHFAEEFNNAFSTLWPGQSQPRPESTFGFFVPLATGEDVYVTYVWNYFVHLHEIFHIALSHQVSVLTGTNHGAVDPEAQNAWLSPDVQDLVDKATRGERG